jgi:carboxypeptidase D
MLDRFMGVDIATVGGKPVDSVIGGEKGPQTSVGGHPNSTVAEEDQAQKLKDAMYKAYYKSGEVAFVVVLIAALAWGFFVWRGRRKRAGYQGLFGSDPDGGSGREGLRHKSQGFSDRDLEAADFDENELESLAEGGEGVNGGAGTRERERRQKERDEDMQRERYSLGGDSGDEGVEDEGGKEEKRANGDGR